MCDARRHFGPNCNSTTEGTAAPSGTTPGARRDAAGEGAKLMLVDSRPLARAIIGTLDAATAMFVVTMLGHFAGTLLAASVMLRNRDGDAKAVELARGMIDGAIDRMNEVTPYCDATPQVYALAAVWWFATPVDTMHSFLGAGRGEVASRALAVLHEVDALRAELDAGTLGARPAEERPAEEPAEARASNDGGGVLPRVALVLYMTEPAAPGHTAIASGLAALTAGVASGEDASGLVRGLAELAAHRAREADDRLKADGAADRLAAALDALDAAALVARVTLDALRAHHGDTFPHSVDVRAA